MITLHFLTNLEMINLIIIKVVFQGWLHIQLPRIFNYFFYEKIKS